MRIKIYKVHEKHATAEIPAYTAIWILFLSSVMMSITWSWKDMIENNVMKEDIEDQTKWSRHSRKAVPCSIDRAVAKQKKKNDEFYL